MEDESEEAKRIVREKVKEANAYADTQLSQIHHHIHFTLQKKAYFKCAYECFEYNNNNINDRDEVEECVDYCSVPVLKAHYLVEDEIAQFQDRLKESMKECQDKFEVATNLKMSKIDAINELETCVDQSVKQNIATLPYVIERLERFLSID